MLWPLDGREVAVEAVAAFWVAMKGACAYFSNPDQYGLLWFFLHLRSFYDMYNDGKSTLFFGKTFFRWIVQTHGRS